MTAAKRLTSTDLHALALAEALGMRPIQAHCHRGLGTPYAKTGQQEQARAALTTAIELLPRHGHELLAHPGRECRDMGSLYRGGLDEIGMLVLIKNRRLA